MPALLNYRGNEEGFPFLYHPPCKRSRVTAPFFFAQNPNSNFPSKPQNPKPNSASHLSINDLPDECLFEILRRLAGAHERSSSACVSKRFLSLLTSIRSSETLNPKKAPFLPDLNQPINDSNQDSHSDAFLTRNLEGKQATDLKLAAISIGTAPRGGLAKLHIRSSRKVSDAGLTAVARSCDQLRVLSIWNCPNVTDGGLTELALGCPNLEKLDLTFCPNISDKGLTAVAKNCKNLKCLTIESCENIANEGLKSVGLNCPNLNSVSLKNCPLVEDSGISSLASSATSLTKVKLHGLNISDNSVAFIGYYCKNVTELGFQNLNLVGEKGFWVMANALGLQNLNILTVISCPGFTDLALISIAKCCTALKTVLVRKSCRLSDAGLTSLAESARLLESLHLEECNRISLNGILASVSLFGPKFKSLSLVKCLGVRDVDQVNGQVNALTCPTVKSLTIRDCTGLTDASLALIGQICPNLENVELSRLGNITDFGIFPLIENCKLVKVNLSGNPNLTDVAISRVVKLNGNSLKVLNLEGCDKITDKIAMEIAQSCTVLNELDLSGSLVTDYGIEILVFNRDLKFRILGLAFCANLTYKSVQILGNLGREIEGLNLQSCVGLSNYSVASLESQLWWCDILY